LGYGKRVLQSENQCETPWVRTKGREGGVGVAESGPFCLQMGTRGRGPNSDSGWKNLGRNGF